MSRQNGKQDIKEGKDYVELVKKFPKRYKIGVYSREKPELGQIMPVNGNTGTVVAIDQPEPEHCIVDVDLEKAISNNTSDKIKSNFNMMANLMKEFGDCRIRLLDKIPKNGSVNEELMVLEFEDTHFSLVGNSPGECINNIPQLMIDAKKLASLTKRKPFKNIVNQFQE